MDTQTQLQTQRERIHQIEERILFAAKGIAISIHDPGCTYYEACPSTCVCGAVKHLNVITSLSWDVMTRVIATYARYSPKNLSWAHIRYQQMATLIHILIHGTTALHHNEQFSKRLTEALKTLLSVLREFDLAMKEYNFIKKEVSENVQVR